MNTLYVILTLWQRTSHIQYVEVLHTKCQMSSVLMQSTFKFQSSAFNSGIKGLNKENNFMHKYMTYTSSFIYLMDNNSEEENWRNPYCMTAVTLQIHLINF